MARLGMFVFGAVCGAALFAGGGTVFLGIANAAEEAGIVDGELWLKSTQAEKRSYLVGAGNLMSVEHLYQQGAKMEPDDDQTIIPRLWDGLDGLTLADLERTITDYYESDPAKRAEAVLVVLWRTVVEPRLESTNLTGSR